MTVELPLCRWRRQPVGPGQHVCISPRIRCNAHGIPDELCYTCKYRDHQPDPPPRLQCRHFGLLLRVAPVKLAGRTDGASVLSRIHGCSLHGECSPNVLHAALPCCMDCADHSPDWVRHEAGLVRHLTYFVWPSGPLWKWNLQQLRRRIGLFNGVRLVAVATDPLTATLEEVRAELADCDIEYLPFTNDPARREMVAHLALVERLFRYRGPADVTWYGHAKGGSSHVYGSGVLAWAEAMYVGTLDYWPAVQAALRDHAAVGVFRRILSPAPAAHVPWHFSGSFRWLRNQDLYARNWRVIEPNWYGPETYPGRHFALQECCCLFGEFAYGGVGLYLQATWDEWATAAADAWYAAHAAQRETPMLLTIILTSHSQPDLVHEAIASVIAQTSESWQLVISATFARTKLDAFDRYASDARIQVRDTGEGRSWYNGPRGQANAINEVMASGCVRGDLVVCLSDDDVLNPGAVAGWIQNARQHADQSAWYGIADRLRLFPDGGREVLPQLGDVGQGAAGHSLRGAVDGLQVCLRRSAWRDWPLEADAAPQADGWWMERVAAATPIHFAPVMVGVHRHTPASTFTR